MKKKTNKYSARPTRSKKGWFVIAILIAVGVYLYNKEYGEPDPFSPVSYITAAEILQNPYVIVDARPSTDFIPGHHAKAINISKDEFTGGYFKLLGQIINGYTVVVYGDPERSDQTATLARMLQNKRVPNVKVFAGSYSDLTSAGVR